MRRIGLLFSLKVVCNDKLMFADNANYLQNIIPDVKVNVFLKWVKDSINCAAFIFDHIDKDLNVCLLRKT